MFEGSSWYLKRKNKVETFHFISTDVLTKGRLLYGILSLMANGERKNVTRHLSHLLLINCVQSTSSWQRKDSEWALSNNEVYDSLYVNCWKIASSYPPYKTVWCCWQSVNVRFQLNQSCKINRKTAKPLNHIFKGHQHFKTAKVTKEKEVREKCTKE